MEIEKIPLEPDQVEILINEVENSISFGIYLQRQTYNQTFGMPDNEISTTGHLHSEIKPWFIHTKDGKTIHL